MFENQRVCRKQHRLKATVPVDIQYGSGYQNDRVIVARIIIYLSSYYIYQNHCRYEVERDHSFFPMDTDTDKQHRFDLLHSPFEDRILTGA